MMSQHGKSTNFSLKIYNWDNHLAGQYDVPSLQAYLSHNLYKWDIQLAGQYEVTWIQASRPVSQSFEVGHSPDRQVWCHIMVSWLTFISISISETITLQVSMRSLHSKSGDMFPILYKLDNPLAGQFEVTSWRPCWPYRLISGHNITWSLPLLPIYTNVACN